MGGGGNLQQSSLCSVFINHPLKKNIPHSPLCPVYSLRSVLMVSFVLRTTLFLLPYGQETL